MHVVDFFFGFSWNLIPARLLIYFVGVTIICFLLGSSWKEQLPYLAGVSVFLLFGYPGIQYLVNTLNASTFVIMFITTIMIVIPLMAIYLVSIGISYPFDPEEKGIIAAFFKAIIFFRFTQWLKIWIFIWTILGVINIAGVAMTQAENIPMLPGASLNPSDAIKTSGEFISRSIETFSNGITKFFSATQKTYQQYMNNTLGGYYTSRVEDTNREKPGISITNFKSEGRYYEGVPNELGRNMITFAPRIIVKLFDEDVKDIKLKCVAYDTSNRSRNITGRLQGIETNNQNTISIYKQDQRTVFCRFNDASDNILTPGRYRVEFSAEFNYVTWAYSKYIFMDREYLEAMRATGEDVRKKFNIPEKIDTVYTAGPAMVGMRKDMIGGLPIGLSTQNNNYVPIGITLDNIDKISGKILNVNSFEVKIPSEFSLNENHCSSKPTGPLTSEISEYSTYTFQPRDSFILDQTYLTIDCDMQASGLNAKNILGGSGGLSEVTVAVKVDYKYLLTAGVSINVEKDPSALRG